MNILIAVNDDEKSSDAIEMANRLFGGSGGERLVMSVARTPEASQFMLDEQRVLDWSAHKAVKAMSARVVGAHSVVSHGDPGRQICDAARDHEVDIIVLGTYDRGLWRRLWAPAVSNYVLHHAPCSVLLVR